MAKHKKTAEPFGTLLGYGPGKVAA